MHAGPLFAPVCEIFLALFDGVGGFGHKLLQDGEELLGIEGFELLGGAVTVGDGARADGDDGQVGADLTETGNEIGTGRSSIAASMTAPSTSGNLRSVSMASADEYAVRTLNFAVSRMSLREEMAPACSRSMTRKQGLVM